MQIAVGAWSSSDDGNDISVVVPHFVGLRAQWLVQSPAIATQHFFALFADDARAAYGQSEKVRKKCGQQLQGTVLVAM